MVETITAWSSMNFYQLFFDEEVLDFLTVETNRYAQQTLNAKIFSCLRKLCNIDRTEMRNFLGLILWMGLMKMPSLRDYW